MSTAQESRPPTWCGDPYADALRAGHGPLYLRRGDGWLLPLDVERWCAVADAADLSALRHCEGAVLDIGCGPGRLVAALAARGHRALGVDVSAEAVAHTVRVGGQALRRSVFEPLPGEGRWDTALLIDGNIGIGGDPPALLERVTQLLVPGGLLLAETAPVDIDERVSVRIDDGLGRVAPDGTFPWARIGTRALLRHARRTGWRPIAQWSAGDRPFVALRRRTDAPTAAPSAGPVRTSSHSADSANSAAVISNQRPRNTSTGSPVAAS
ncbi:class I SAM-dependent methyltransferase [Streptomyces sp. NPDC058001]|uniref:class I SAM-dependent methyltransferase n=1 Tax=Streptomyces sp. NPDC058001 TaxID=3346300 RepID=UPI0036E9286A